MTRHSNVTMISRSQSRSTRHQTSTSVMVSKISRSRTTQAFKHNHKTFICNALKVRKPMHIHLGMCIEIKPHHTTNQMNRRIYWIKLLHEGLQQIYENRKTLSEIINRLWTNACSKRTLNSADQLQSVEFYVFWLQMISHFGILF